MDLDAVPGPEWVHPVCPISVASSPMGAALLEGALMAGACATVERWIGEQDGRLQWLRPEAGAFCCARLNPDTFGPPDVRRFLRPAGRTADGRRTRSVVRRQRPRDAARPGRRAG